ncbi:MAG: hypothetical protein GXP30_00450, partial [Verrucomicrobia bacterium]|nr:hypothetical protein [Verrucomicrobiota bacterium]
MNGCLKMLMVSAVSAFIGVLLLGVLGGLAYMNREKLGIPPMEEWAAQLKMKMNE